MEYPESEGTHKDHWVNSYKFSDTNSTEVSQRADLDRWKTLICKGILCSAVCWEPQCCFRVQGMSQLQIHLLKGMLSFWCAAYTWEVQGTLPMVVATNSFGGNIVDSQELPASNSPCRWLLASDRLQSIQKYSDLWTVLYAMDRFVLHL